jgi:hypothetical protein
MDALTDGTLAAARRVVEDVVMRQFSPGVVAAVDVRPKVFEDEEDLWIQVVLSGPFRDAERENKAGLELTVRERLVEMGETRFPVVDYITKAEFLKIRRAAPRLY